MFETSNTAQRAQFNGMKMFLFKDYKIGLLMAVEKPKALGIPFYYFSFGSLYVNFTWKITFLHILIRNPHKYKLYDSKNLMQNKIYQRYSIKMKKAMRLLLSLPLTPTHSIGHIIRHKAKFM